MTEMLSAGSIYNDSIAIVHGCFHRNTGEVNGTDVKVKQEKITGKLTVRKKRDRFNGMPEEEVLARTLPDHMAPNLDIVIVSHDHTYCGCLRCSVS